jgi:hypothetical protein
MPLRRLTLCCLLLGCFLFGLLAGVPAAEIPSDPAPRWWKGNLHTHSLWSDGNDFPEMIAEWYRTHGYNFLAISDHNVLAEGQRWMRQSDIDRRAGATGLEKYLARFGQHWVETRPTADGGQEVRLKPFDEYRALVEERGTFLMIPSEEISDSAERVPVHLNATNLAEVIAPVGGTTVREAIENNVRAVEEQAARKGREIIIHLNHPNFGLAITAEDLAAVLSERFFEVYNGHPGVQQLGDTAHPSVERLWDIANTIRIAQLDAPPLWGIATDDSHDYHGMSGSARPGRGWTQVRARHLTPESLIRALRRGDMYASSGVTLDDVRYDTTSGLLQLDIVADGDATFTTQFIGTTEGYNADSEPATDGAGQQIRASRKYSADVGRVLAEADGLHPTYQLTGQELYVRAVVTSSRPHVDPSFEGQHQQAWTQPVGWEQRLESK